MAGSFSSIFQAELKVGQNLETLVTPGRPIFSEEVRLALFRIAEETLNNATKYSGAGHVELLLEWFPTGLIQMRVKDDGVGFDRRHIIPGLGFNAMEDYAGTLGGQVTIDSSPGQGAVVTATVPADLLVHPP